MHEPLLVLGQRYHRLCKKYPLINRTAAVCVKRRRAISTIICCLLLLNVTSHFGKSFLQSYFYSHADQEAWRFRWALLGSILCPAACNMLDKAGERVSICGCNAAAQQQVD